MKRIIFTLALMAFVLYSSSQDNFVCVEKVGTLDSLLNALSLKDATQLTVSGELNGSDIKTLRYMLGGRYMASLEEHSGKLETLDLTGAVIRAGGDAYLFLDSSSEPDPRMYTSDNTIGDMMFWDCIHLKELSLPLSITAIGRGAFQECVSLKSMKIPTGVSTIDYGMFWGCHSLESVTLPSSLTYVDNYVIEECPNMKSLKCSSQEPPKCEDKSFNEVEGITLYVPVGSKEKYKSAAGWSVFAAIIEDNSLGIKNNHNPSASFKAQPYYDLSGRRLNDKPAKGIYIQNGRKFVVR